MSPTQSSTKRGASTKPAFIAAFVLLAICACSFNVVARVLKAAFTKEPLSLRVNSLKEGIPAKMGRWMQVSTDQGINPEEEQVLGTSQYVFRDYVNINSLKVQAAEIDQLNKATANERAQQLAMWRQTNPTAIMRVAVTYYTGMVDTVAHVPERCYVADGYEVKQAEKIQSSLGLYRDGSSRDLELRFLSFEDASNIGSRVQNVTRYVGYVFHCDGKYESESYAVRADLQNLLERYGYYAKVELMIEAPNVEKSDGSAKTDYHEASVAAMKDFLVVGLPEVEKCLPDWQAAHQKTKK